MRITTVRRLGLATAIVALPVFIASPQTTQYHEGQAIELAPGVTVRVSSTDPAAFPGIKLTGPSRVFELDFEKQPGHFIALEPWTDPMNSGVVLLVGGNRVPPKALAVRQAQRPERDVVPIDKLERNRVNGRGAWVGFSSRPNVQFLFEIPVELTERAETLVVEVLLDGKPAPVRVEIIKNPSPATTPNHPAEPSSPPPNE